MILQIEWVDRGLYNILQINKPIRQLIARLAIQYVESMIFEDKRLGLRSSLKAAKIGNKVYDISEYSNNNLTNLFNIMLKADTIPRLIVQII
jgi:hypothetical protein